MRFLTLQWKLVSKKGDPVGNAAFFDLRVKSGGRVLSIGKKLSGTRDVRRIFPEGKEWLGKKAGRCFCRKSHTIGGNGCMIMIGNQI